MGKLICINTSSFGVYDKKPIVLLEKKGFDVKINPHKRKLTKEEVMNFCQDAVCIIAGTEILDADVLNHCKNLKIISRCGTGFDNVDLKAAAALGVKVFNTPDAPTLAVAELTVGLILNLIRKVNQMDHAIRNGRWEKLMGNLISGKKVGIIGFGRIGKKVAELLEPFNCEISYFDPFVEDKLAGFNRLSKNDLLESSDILSIHVSSKDKILTEDDFRLMKKGTWLINVSRGNVLDEVTLYKYLTNGSLSGAALDVFENEPYHGQLTELPNVVLTPHIGSYAKESRIDMEMQAAKNLLQGLTEVNNK
jgi:D-3-phosphoglycerate dehydrogenase